jgi:glutaredoxin-dependent peroxiredoxin
METARFHLFELVAKLLIIKVVAYCLIHIQITEKESMKIEIGMQAPGFTLFDSDKNHVSLSNFAGQNVLLLFYPLAFTSVCTKELCAVRDNIGQYDQLNAVVLGISVDSLYTLAKYKQEQGYNFPLLSDFNKEVSLLYGSLYENFAFGMKGVSKRSAFVIDKDGIVRYAEVLENAGEIPNFDAIQTSLASLS